MFGESNLVGQVQAADVAADVRRHDVCDDVRRKDGGRVLNRMDLEMFAKLFAAIELLVADDAHVLLLLMLVVVLIVLLMLLLRVRVFTHGVVFVVGYCKIFSYKKPVVAYLVMVEKKEIQMTDYCRYLDT